MPRRSPFDSPVWTERIAKWAHHWGLPELPGRVTISVSTRMRVSLGRCAPRAGTIRIASFLLGGPEDLLEEVLCHELAHVAVVQLHGPRCRPHGREWRALMLAAGRTPRARIPAAEFERLVPLHAGKRVMWEHRCPVCRASRVAGRPVQEWRCARCQRIGLRGRLVVRRIGANADSR